MNRINKLFSTKQGNILSIYFTAGFPELDSTVTILKSLEQAGVDMIEIGMPFSDPMADGPQIQKSNDLALKNGMSLKILFNQLEKIRDVVKIPLLLMGYLNPVYQYGIENFCRKCAETGIDGIILPDLPLEVYSEKYESIFRQFNLHNIFLISPQTSDERIRKIAGITEGFIYMVSSSSTTGEKKSFSPDQIAYFERIKSMRPDKPRLIGFGISDNAGFSEACRYADGAIIGSAFVRLLSERNELNYGIDSFIKEIRKAGV